MHIKREVRDPTSALLPFGTLVHLPPHTHANAQLAAPPTLRRLKLPPSLTQSSDGGGPS